jgi:hypothetical protein
MGFAYGSADDRPRPTPDGVDATYMAGKQHWALRSDGDFYFTEEFPEDDTDDQALFIDTRIQRVTETMMLASGLYRALGVDRKQRVGLRIAHRGLSYRRLRFSSVSTFADRAGTADRVHWDRVVALEELDTDLIGLVRECCENLFELFEFASVDDDVYERIIYAFQDGKITWLGS